jgi:hypothetical protein
MFGTLKDEINLGEVRCSLFFVSHLRQPLLQSRGIQPLLCIIPAYKIRINPQKSSENTEVIFSEA